MVEFALQQIFGVCKHQRIHKVPACVELFDLPDFLKVAAAE